MTGPRIGGCLVGFSISWNIANTGPVATQLAHRYGTSLGVIGLLTTVLFFTELLVMVPGGRAIDRYGAKRVALLGIAMMLPTNLLLLVPTSVVAALALRAFGGLGVGFGFLAGAIYAQAGAGRSAPLASGIYGGSSLAGGGAALAVVPQLVPAFSWRAPYASGAIVAALALPLVAVCPKTPGQGAERSVPPFKMLMADARIVRLGLVASVSFGFSVILGNWVVTLLERSGGLGRGRAGAIASLILIVGIVSRPGGGLMARARPELTRSMLAASFVVGALSAVGIALSLGSAVDAVAAAFAGLAAGVPFGITIAGATRAYPGAAGAAVGAMNTYAVLTIVCGAPLVGLSFGLPGRGRVGFAVIAALWAAALALLPRLEFARA